MQFMSENHLNGYQIFVRYGFLKPDPNHISGFRTSLIDVCLSFIPSQRDCCGSSQPVWWKLAVMIGPTSTRNWLTFGGDPVLDMDSELFFKNYVTTVEEAILW